MGVYLSRLNTIVKIRLKGEDSKGLLSTYKKDNNGGVDISGFIYKKKVIKYRQQRLLVRLYIQTSLLVEEKKKQSNTRFHL